MSQRITVDWQAHLIASRSDLYSVDQQDFGYAHDWKGDIDINTIVQHVVKKTRNEPRLHSEARNGLLQFVGRVGTAQDTWFTTSDGDRGCGRETEQLWSLEFVSPVPVTVPAVADVWQIMNEIEVSQDTAVIILGGTP